MQDGGQPRLINSASDLTNQVKYEKSVRLSLFILKVLLTVVYFNHYIPSVRVKYINIKHNNCRTD